MAAGEEFDFWKALYENEHGIRTTAEEMREEAKEILIEVYWQVAPDHATVREREHPYWKKHITIDELGQVILERVRRAWAKPPHTQQLIDKLISHLCNTVEQIKTEHGQWKTQIEHERVQWKGIDDQLKQLDHEKLQWEVAEGRLKQRIAQLEDQLEGIPTIALCEKSEETETIMPRREVETAVLSSAPPPLEIPPDEMESLMSARTLAPAPLPEEDARAGYKTSGERDWATETAEMARRIAVWPERDDLTSRTREFVKANKQVRIKNTTMLWLIGASGFSRRSMLEGVLVEAKTLLPNPSRLLGRVRFIITSKANTSLERLGIVKVTETKKAGISGSSAGLVELTSAGESVYRELFGRIPAESELCRLRSCHHNNIHAFLIMEAADLLVAAGYRLLSRTPEPLQVSSGEYSADLRLADPRNGEIIYVEVERGGNKKDQEREAKWRRCYQATGGDIYVVTANESAMNAIGNEIRRCIRDPMRLRLTNISHFLVPKRRKLIQVETIWLTNP